MKALIIDDEPKARQLLNKLLSDYCPDVQVVAMAEDVPSGLAAYREHQPDMIFLDVEMPGQNGFELLESIETMSFALIFTTAYEQYALKALKSDALDYLLKPLDIDQLKIAVAKAKTWLAQQVKVPVEPIRQALREQPQNNAVLTGGKIALPVSDGLMFVNRDDILYLEADRSYTYLFLLGAKSKIVVSKNLGELELLLGDTFFRIHRSHTVNLRRVVRFFKRDGGCVEIEGGQLLDVSPTRRDEFLALFHKQANQAE